MNWGFFRSRALLLLIFGFFEFAGTHAWAAIPLAERTVLLNIYTSTNGGTWNTSTNWNGAPGTECFWYGVTCNAGATLVVGIFLTFNNLSGTLPALSNLTNLQTVNVQGNQLTGSIPSLAGLASLADFRVNNNQLTGSIPSLAGLGNLFNFSVNNNQLTGSIPSLAGTNLINFDVSTNQLTGSIPSLAGLGGLQVFNAVSNQLTGSIPSLAGLANLVQFQVNNNQLTGNVPAVPSPNHLAAGASQLCPNYLNHTTDPAWDAATGSTPWYVNCTAAPAAPAGATAVPTLGTWATILLVGLLALLAVGSMRRRRDIGGLRWY